MNYGLVPDSLATQVLLRSYGPGDVGSIALSNPAPQNYGADVAALVSSGIGLATTVVGTVGGVKAGQQQQQIAQAEAEAAAAQAQASGLLAAAQQQSAQTYAIAGVGALVLVTLLGGGIYYMSTRK